MDFSEKLQALRKQKGLTQEELASQLFVSRTAVSKWESGRGYPGIDSLKALSKYFSVSVDLLLSDEELITVAEETGREKERRCRSLTFALSDIGMVLLCFLPLFGQADGGETAAVSLLSLTGVQPYVMWLYGAAVLVSTGFGLASLCLMRCENPAWVRCSPAASVAVSIAAVVLFIITRQPYAAVFALLFMVIKGAMLMKRA